MRVIILLAILSLTSCSGPKSKSDENYNETVSNKLVDFDKSINTSDQEIPNNTSSPPAQIGGANMDKDGTIHLHLSFEDGNGIGEGYFTYKKTDKDYKYILNHIGPIKPGQGKAVYAFPPADPAARRE